MGRDRIVIGNWKMYKTSREAADYIEHLAKKIEGCSTRVYLAVPYTSIASASNTAKQSGILIGAQNMNDARDGAFTGEIAAMMLKEAGADFVILGHSERRRIFNESDEFIHRKVIRALSDDLQTVLCVGETGAEREEGKTEEVLLRQIESALQDVPDKAHEKVILAYEPVWAIGTGKTATAQAAQEAHAYCRKCLEQIFGKRKSGHISILYGGSVNPDKVKEIVKQKDIDGVLVGGASLDPDTLAAIIHQCEGKR
ncbi:MAG: tpiA [Parachlamydiales bacterium]|nr:tpiA [Parachlamydiales bacterium]